MSFKLIHRTLISRLPLPNPGILSADRHGRAGAVGVHGIRTPFSNGLKKEMPEMHNELSLCRLTVPEIRAGDGLNDDFFYRTSQALASL